MLKDRNESRRFAMTITFTFGTTFLVIGTLLCIFSWVDQLGIRGLVKSSGSNDHGVIIFKTAGLTLFLAGFEMVAFATRPGPILFIPGIIFMLSGRLLSPPSDTIGGKDERAHSVRLEFGRIMLILGALSFLNAFLTISPGN
ncbi:MAG: hypothetical protein A2391_01770 [Candidatus Brennerbacteria bacterium RIFOXYB1_FULL_41_13]|uniref:Uncharacterized protein n=1 Tax=Candidatus Brennerbacteria bacterium RIFOXYD1_FULL_41_16 TaxID=1797529 RepID=A0A1G1XJP2_9BACT|nr:MAG: hypothetical protein A2391_01770 [Candidatus Brennerbacteria bacterium RIFOXYB1_FULL_41_13]OGY40303.1 MAG: hypothetical protein A2570_03435 [Candidatus Brennerbacteria bacterium RIFOXYD1_FULL_41_16]